METVFVALDDPALRDQIKTCIKNFDNLRGVALPPDHLLEVLAGDHNASALILEWRGSGARPDPVISTIREFDSNLKMTVRMGSPPFRGRFRLVMKIPREEISPTSISLATSSLSPSTSLPMDSTGCMPK